MSLILVAVPCKEASKQASEQKYIFEKQILGHRLEFFFSKAKNSYFWITIAFDPENDL